MSNRFWEISESEEFKRAFRNLHPLIQQNQPDFYRIDNLDQRLKVIQSELMKARTPRSVATLGNMLRVTKDWIKQAEWIQRRIDQMTFESWEEVRE